MVELLAIVRRNRAQATKAELHRIRCRGYTIFPVLGRGRQRGLRGLSDDGLPFLPKMLFEVVVEGDARETIEAIIRANQTGEFGDGKIFVLELGEGYRISTGERCSPSEVVG